MSTEPSNYVFDSLNECDRLERQAALQGLDRLLPYFPSTPAACILDAGCGSGAMGRLLASRNPSTQVVGVDFNPGYVAYARKRASQDELTNLSFETGDLQDLAFDDRSFDIIWSQFVLYFLPHPEAALKEFRRLIKPGGTVLISLHYRPIMTNYPEESGLQER